MTVSVYNERLERVGILYNFISLLWEEHYNSQGSFLLETGLTAGITDILRPWYFCETERSSCPMVIVSVEVYDNKVTAAGFPATYILTKRASNMLISNINAEHAMRCLVAGMTSWDRVTLGVEKGITDVFEGTLSGMSVFEYCEKIGSACDIGFYMRRSGGYMVFECRKPQQDVNARYSVMLGNLGDVRYTVSDVGGFNVAVVKGKDPEGNITVVTVGDTAKQGNKRFEKFVDAGTPGHSGEEGEPTFLEKLEAKGLEELAQCGSIKSAQFELDDDGLEVGDMITAELYGGLAITARIDSVTLRCQDNAMTRRVTVGSPIKTEKRALI